MGLEWPEKVSNSDEYLMQLILRKYIFIRIDFVSEKRTGRKYIWTQSGILNYLFFKVVTTKVVTTSSKFQIMIILNQSAIILKVSVVKDS